jgi:hypothetical protein
MATLHRHLRDDLTFLFIGALLFGALSLGMRTMIGARHANYDAYMSLWPQNG